MQVREILMFMRKWLWLLLLACFIGGTAGFIVDFFQPKIYEADTTLFVNSPGHSDNSSVLGGQQLASAFVLIPSSVPVLKASLQELSNTSLSVLQLSSMVTVNNNRDTQYVTISVKDRDPQRAARLAMAIAEQSIVQFQATANDASRTQFKKEELDRIETEIKNLEAEIADAQADPQPDPIAQADHISRLSTALATLQGSYSLLLNSSEADIQIDIVNPAVVPSVPIGTGPKFAIAIGVLAGLIVIVGVIILIEQSDTIIRTPAKVKRVTGLPILLTIGYLPAVARQTSWLNGYHEVANKQASQKSKERFSGIYRQKTAKPSENYQEIVALLENDVNAISEDTVKQQAIQVKPTSAAKTKPQKDKQKSESFQLYSGFLALGVSLRREGIRSLLVTSAEHGEGKTTVASQIALGLARIGVEVILVDGNLRKPEVHTVFGFSNNAGLSTFLNTSQTINETGQKSDISFVDLQAAHEPNLSILSGGPPLASPMEGLSSSRMADMLRKLKQQAVVVIDCPPILTSNEALILADKSDGIVVVVDAHSTSSTVLKQSLDMLAMVNPNVIGVILNRANELKGSAWTN